ncbi:AraC family ligand binding domain-containing protein [Brachybacterium sp. GPGPB12]|uniref:AraC family ligand binding domain-containing protein n=1 Tax=Brachybacterium sp. GPGPB12 TaxID=3023517 RepID=UPI0031343434
MDDPAARRQVPAVELPAPETGRVLVGEPQQEADYRVRRSRGTTDWSLLAHTVAGAGLVHSADGVSLTTSTGQSVLIRPGTLQDYGTDPAAGGWHLLYVHVHPPAPWLAPLDWPEAADGLLTIRLGAAVDARVQAGAHGRPRRTPGRRPLRAVHVERDRGGAALVRHSEPAPAAGGRAGARGCSSTSTRIWTRSSLRRGSRRSPTSPPRGSRTCSPRRRARRCAATSRRADGGRREVAGDDPGPCRRGRAAGRVRRSAVLLAPLPGARGAEPVGPSGAASDRLNTGR